MIVLVITIIVIIILAVAVILTLSQNNPIENAKKAVSANNKATLKEELSLLMSDYALNNITSEKTDFATYLRKNLQVVVSDNGDGTYSFLVGQWQVVLTKDKIISIEKFELDVDKIYPSVAVMKADTELVEGKLVQTESYRSSKCGGSAYYDIVDPTNLTADEGKYIQLDNGLIAQLHAINNTVTVNQFGAYGDGNNDDSAAINAAINSGFANIYFESEEYKFDSRIDIKSSDITIMGNNAKLICDDDFVFKDDYLIQVFNTNEEYVNDVVIQDLSVINNNVVRTDSILMFKVKSAENIELYKCNLETPYVEGNKERIVTNIDFRDYYKNIEINGCNLINITNGPAGGSIYLRTGIEGTGNVSISKNYINKSCHDEPIAIFGSGSIDNVVIDNNVMIFDDSNVEVPSWPVINFGASTDSEQISTINNVKLINNDIKAIANAGFITVVNASNILVANNNMDFLSLHETYASYFASTNSTNVSVENNNIKLENKNESAEAEIFLSIDKINNNVIDLNLEYIYVFDTFTECSNNKVTFNKNRTRIRGTIFNIRNKTLNKDITIANNELHFKTIMNDDLNTRLISFYNMYLNNHKVNIMNNNVYGVEGQGTNLKFAVYFDSMKDTTPQKVYSTNNNFGFFQNIGNNNNSTTYEIVEE